MSRASLPVFCASAIGSRLYPGGYWAPVNLAVTTLRAMAVYLQWVSDPPGSGFAVAAPHPCPPRASLARLTPANGEERERTATAALRRQTAPPGFPDGAAGPWAVS